MAISSSAKLLSDFGTKKGAIDCLSLPIVRSTLLDSGHIRCGYASEE